MSKQWQYGTHIYMTIQTSYIHVDSTQYMKYTSAFIRQVVHTLDQAPIAIAEHSRLYNLAYQDSGSTQMDSERH